jgi:hypothetical protein
VGGALNISQPVLDGQDEFDAEMELALNCGRWTLPNQRMLRIGQSPVGGDLD